MNRHTCFYTLALTTAAHIYTHTLCSVFMRRVFREPPPLWTERLHTHDLLFLAKIYPATWCVLPTSCTADSVCVQDTHTHTRFQKFVQHDCCEASILLKNVCSVGCVLQHDWCSPIRSFHASSRRHTHTVTHPMAAPCCLCAHYTHTVLVNCRPATLSSCTICCTLLVHLLYS